MWSHQMTYPDLVRCIHVLLKNKRYVLSQYEFDCYLFSTHFDPILSILIENYPPFHGEFKKILEKSHATRSLKNVHTLKKITEKKNVHDPFLIGERAKTQDWLIKKYCQHLSFEKNLEYFSQIQRDIQELKTLTLFENIQDPSHHIHQLLINAESLRLLERKKILEKKPGLTGQLKGRADSLFEICEDFQRYLTQLGKDLSSPDVTYAGDVFYGMMFFIHHENNLQNGLEIMISALDEGRTAYHADIKKFDTVKNSDYTCLEGLEQRLLDAATSFRPQEVKNSTTAELEEWINEFISPFVRLQIDGGRVPTPHLFQLFFECSGYTQAEEEISVWRIKNDQNLTQAVIHRVVENSQKNFEEASEFVKNRIAHLHQLSEKESLSFEENDVFFGFDTLFQKDTMIQNRIIPPASPISEHQILENLKNATGLSSFQLELILSIIQQNSKMNLGCCFGIEYCKSIVDFFSPEEYREQFFSKESSSLDLEKFHQKLIAFYDESTFNHLIYGNEDHPEIEARILLAITDQEQSVDQVGFICTEKAFIKKIQLVAEDSVYLIDDFEKYSAIFGLSSIFSALFDQTHDPKWNQIMISKLMTHGHFHLIEMVPPEQLTLSHEMRNFIFTNLAQKQYTEALYWFFNHIEDLSDSEVIFKDFQIALLFGNFDFIEFYLKRYPLRPTQHREIFNVIENSKYMTSIEKDRMLSTLIENDSLSLIHEEMKICIEEEWLLALKALTKKGMSWSGDSGSWIFATIENDSANSCEFLIQNGATYDIINPIEKDGCIISIETPLTEALKKNAIGVCKKLIQHNITIDFSFKYPGISEDLNPFIKSLLYHRTEVFFALLDKGLNWRKKISYASQIVLSVPFFAVQYQCWPAIEALLQNGLDINEEITSQKQSLLILAVQTRSVNYSLIKNLLEHGANPELRDSHNQTVLSLAYANRLSEVMKYLINHGACLDLPDQSSLLALCIRDGYDEIADLIIKHGGNLFSKHPHSNGLIGQHVSNRQALLSFYQKTQQKTRIQSDEQQAFFEAINKKDCIDFRFLIQISTNRNHTSPFLFAVQYGFKDVVSNHIMHQPDQFPVDLQGCHAFHYAMVHDHDEILQLLLEHYPEYLNRKSFDFSTPLMTAVTNHARKCFEILMKRADTLLNESDTHGYSALLIAIRLKRIQMAQRLTEKGAGIIFNQIFFENLIRFYSKEIFELFYPQGLLACLNQRVWSTGPSFFMQICKYWTFSEIEVLLNEIEEKSIKIDLNIRNEYQESLIEIWMYTEKPDLLKRVLLLENHPVNWTAMRPEFFRRIACEKNPQQSQTIEALRTAGFCFKVQDRNHKTLLMYAAESGNTILSSHILFTLGYQDEILKRDSKHWDALCYAVSSGHIEMIDFLIAIPAENHLSPQRLEKLQDVFYFQTSFQNLSQIFTLYPQLFLESFWTFETFKKNILEYRSPNFGNFIQFRILRMDTHPFIRKELVHIFKLLLEHQMEYYAVTLYGNANGLEKFFTDLERVNQSETFPEFVINHASRGLMRELKTCRHFSQQDATHLIEWSALLKKKDIFLYFFENHWDEDCAKKNANLLMFSAKYGYEELVDECLQDDSMRNQLDLDDSHAIFYVSMNAIFDLHHLNTLTAKKNIVSKLIRYYDINTLNSFKETPLLKAVFHGGPLSLIETLLEHGADINLRLEDNKTVLWFARSREMFDFLVKNGASLSMRSENGMNILMYLLSDGEPVLIPTVLTYPIDLQERDLFGWTALMHAADPHCLHGLEKRLAQKHDQRTIDFTRKMLTYSTKSNAQTLLQHLKSTGDLQLTQINMALQTAYDLAQKSDILGPIFKEYQMSVKNNPTINTQSEMQLLFSHHQYLLEHHHVDETIKDSQGALVLHYAAQLNSLDFVQNFIISHPECINIPDENFKTPLEYALNAPGFETAEYLMQQGAEIELLDFSSRMNLLKKTHSKITLSKQQDHFIQKCILNESEEENMMFLKTALKSFMKEIHDHPIPDVYIPAHLKSVIQIMAEHRLEQDIIRTILPYITSPEKTHVLITYTHYLYEVFSTTAIDCETFWESWFGMLIASQDEIIWSLYLENIQSLLTKENQVGLFFQSIRSGAERLFQALMKLNPDLVNEPDPLSMSPLMIALRCQRIDFVHELLNAGAHVDYLNIQQKTIFDDLAHMGAHLDLLHRMEEKSQKKRQREPLIFTANNDHPDTAVHKKAKR